MGEVLDATYPTATAEWHPTGIGGLTESLHEELASIARMALSHERRGHTLETGALVNEAFLRLRSQRNLDDEDRTVFLAAASVTMRRVLVDYARRRRAAKRGGAVEPAPFDDAIEVIDARATDIIELDEALTDLARLDERKARVVELRFFGGMPVDEVAQTLGVPKRTVERDWTMARAWLRTRLGEGVGP